MTSYPSRICGALPVDAINAVLGTDLEPGDARLSARAHEHMAKDHPADYPICIAALEAAIVAPTFIGQAPTQRDNFEIIKRIARPGDKAVLVAISLEPDKHGAYRIRSCYLISARVVEERRQAGRLKALPPR